MNAAPFRHTIIEDFFDAEFAERLLQDFPSFDPKLAKNEFGQVGNKAVNTKIREITPSYAELYELIGSRAFLELISEISGIPDLMMDPALYGGGTHENRHGQDLDPHVDFNYDQQRGRHRRLNLIVYLNKGWKEEWGGSIEIHSNPRRPEENQIKSWAPTFNRAVMFETNEYSWHGFPVINLPEEERHRSRKSISIYLYTKDRPAEEIAPVHGTFYVQRPLPERIRAGYTLQEADVQELAGLLGRRDKWIETYQKVELEKNRDIGTSAAFIEEMRSLVRAPLTGYMLQTGHSRGIYSDRWVAPNVVLTVAPQRPVTELVLRGWRPPAEGPVEVTVRLNGTVAASALAAAGMFELPIPVPAPLDQPFTVELENAPSFLPENDPRDICYVLVELRAEHAPVVTGFTEPRT